MAAGAPTNPMIELMLTIEPPPVFCHVLGGELVPRKTLAG